MHSLSCRGGVPLSWLEVGVGAPPVLVRVPTPSPPLQAGLRTGPVTGLSCNPLERTRNKALLPPPEKGLGTSDYGVPPPSVNRQTPEKNILGSYAGGNNCGFLMSIFFILLLCVKINVNLVAAQCRAVCQLFQQKWWCSDTWQIANVYKSIRFEKFRKNFRVTWKCKKIRNSYFGESKLETVAIWIEKRLVLFCCSVFE